MTTKENAPLAVVRKLTPEERFKVRQILDAKFDEQKGYYLEAYTDQKVGAEVNVPWSAVRELREAAYGPLRSVPELDALMAESTALLERANRLAQEAAALHRRVLDTQKNLGVSG